MRSHLILKEKLHAAPGKSRHKARLVIDGNNQFPAPTRADTYASTPSATAIRTLIASQHKMVTLCTSWTSHKHFYNLIHCPTSTNFS